jgi:tRNA-dihydrouridine synthase
MTQAKAISTNTEGLHDGSFYTAFAMPGDDGHSPRLRIVNDHLNTPANGKAQLRIVHAGVGAGEVDVREAGGPVLFEGVDYESVTDYHEVTPVNGVIEIIGNGDESVLNRFNTHLDAGRFYTILIVGNALGNPKIEAFLIEDALAP